MKRLFLWFRKRKFRAYEQFDTEPVKNLMSALRRTGYNADELRWSLK